MLSELDDAHNPGIESGVSDVLDAASPPENIHQRSRAIGTWFTLTTRLDLFILGKSIQSVL